MTLQQLRCHWVQGIFQLHYGWMGSPRLIKMMICSAQLQFTVSNDFYFILAAPYKENQAGVHFHFHITEEEIDTWVLT